MEEGEDYGSSWKLAVSEAGLRNEYYWKLVADFIGPQSGEGLELDHEPCKNRLLIQVGLLRDDNNFPWVAITEWLKKIFPRHFSADFRCLIERGIATTLSLMGEARLVFLESYVNFNFVGPICDSIGVERVHLLEMKDFSERAQSIEVSNGLILELNNFITREKIAPVILVHWLRNFNQEFCKDGNIQKGYKLLKSKIKKLKQHYRNHETRSHRRNAVMESLLQSPFNLVDKKMDSCKLVVKKPVKKENTEEDESYDITPSEEADTSRGVKTEPIDQMSADEEDCDGLEGGKEEYDRNRGALTLLDITMLSVQKLSSGYGGDTAACKQLSLDLLKNQYALMCKEHPAMAAFDKTVNSLKDVIPLVSPVVFLHSHASFFVDLHNALEKQTVLFEKEIMDSSGEKLGRDRLPEFKNFVNLSESATSRYIHMACDILSSCSPKTQNYRKHWLAFCEEKKNPSQLPVKQTNRFNSYLEAAAGLVHHHREISLFLSDMLSLDDDSCKNVLLESVAADACDSAIQSLVCVLAIVHCKIFGPYWQLLQSGGEYSLFSQYILCLYQKFLDWSKNPSTLLEPEEAVNVFLQLPMQEGTYAGVFSFCGQWHTNRDLIRACLKRMIKVIASVTEEHLKDFLPGGMHSQTLSPELSLQMVNCTFSVLSAEYPFSLAQEKKTPEKSSRQSPSMSSPPSDSSEEDNDTSSSSDDDATISPSWQSKKRILQPKKKVGKVLFKREHTHEATEERMDRDYIIATVERNGGSCKSQPDVDKMMLRFDGKTRTEKREALRCEILYQKMILNNTDPNLDCPFINTTQMALKLKLSLPRVKPGFSLVLAPRKTKPKAVRLLGEDAVANQNKLKCQS